MLLLLLLVVSFVEYIGIPYYISDVWLRIKHIHADDVAVVYYIPYTGPIRAPYHWWKRTPRATSNEQRATNKSINCPCLLNCGVREVAVFRFPVSVPNGPSSRTRMCLCVWVDARRSRVANWTHDDRESAPMRCSTIRVCVWNRDRTEISKAHTRPLEHSNYTINTCMAEHIFDQRVI